MINQTKSPGIMTDDDRIGTIIWSVPDNAKTDNSIYTVCALSGSGTSHYLKASDFNFTIPIDATVFGIKVEIEKQYSSGSGTCVDNEVKLVKNDGTIGEVNEATAIAWTPSHPYVPYGGETSLWDINWTPDMVNSADFGVVLSIKEISVTQRTVTGRVDYIQITVYYATYTENLVIIAETTLSQTDIDNAQVAVSILSDSTDKDDLQARITECRKTKQLNDYNTAEELKRNPVKTYTSAFMNNLWDKLWFWK